MALVNDIVLVLKSINFSEADKILTVFGRARGKYTLLAKGVRKIESKNRGNIQTMSLSKVSFFEGANMGILRESDLVYAPTLDVKQLTLAQKLLYLINKVIPEDEKEEAIFDMLANLIQGEITPRTVNEFRVKFLLKLGYLPDLRSCSICSRRDKLKYFLPAQFEVVCSECGEKLGNNEDRLIPLDAVKYHSNQMTVYLDRFIAAVVE